MGSDDTDRDARLAAATTGMTLAYWAARQPDVPAFVSADGDRTFAQLNANANRLARALRASGLRAGDSVALMVSNRPEFAEALAAANRAGLRLTTINWHLTGEEVSYIASDCEAKAFIADARFAVAATDAAARSADRVRGAGARGGAEITRIAIGGELDGFDRYDEVLAPHDGSDLDDPVLGSSMLYTSGTTGRPKGVHRDVPSSSAASASLANIFGYVPGGETVHLCTGPLYHAAPLAFSLAGPLNAGAGVVVMDGWSAERTLELIAEHRITHTHMVPTMFHRLLSLPDDVRDKADVSSLRLVLHGAAPCPVHVKQALIEWWGPVVVEYYAATEGVGTFVTSDAWLAKPGTVGKPAAADHITILDDDGIQLPAGEIGTVYLKAPDTGRFAYYKDPDKTASSYHGNYHTMGDVGYLDDDGFLFLTDRSADLIISGGVNIYPAEIEAALLSHPAVGDAAVIGVPNDEWGETVVAVVELQPDVEPTPALAGELIEHCRAHLARFKCPRQVDFVDRLPRHDNGKLYKRRLRDEYRERAAERAS
jgi:long-chain acyl-CoA synthetase